MTPRAASKTSISLSDVDEVAKDRIVEVVGVGHRVAQSGDTYRVADHTFAFDENAIVKVWL